MKRIFFIILIAFTLPLRAEDLITSQQGLSDGFYGFRMQVFINPAYENRDRDTHSGLGLKSPDDSYGFVLRRSTVRISKIWEDSGIEAVLQGDVIRNHNLSRDTALDNGTKNDPYLFFVSNAYAQKSFVTGEVSHYFRLGIQDVPSFYLNSFRDKTYHFMTAMPETLRFTPDVHDAGFSYILKYQFFTMQWMIANGEGALQAQGKDSSGLDLLGRISFEPANGGLIHVAGHLFYRRANIGGFSGNECREGQTPCLASDQNAATNLEKDLRSIRDQYFGAEGVVSITEYFRMNFGGFLLKDYGGVTQDLIPGRSVSYSPDLTGYAKFAGFSAGRTWLKFSLRYDTGTGTTGFLTATQSRRLGLSPYLDQPAAGATSPALQLLSPGSYNFEDKSRYQRFVVALDFEIFSGARVAFGAETFIFSDRNGSPGKSYVDVLGMERTQNEFLNQFRYQGSQGISEFSRDSVHWFLRGGIWF